MRSQKPYLVEQDELGVRLYAGTCRWWFVIDATVVANDIVNGKPVILSNFT